MKNSKKHRKKSLSEVFGRTKLHKKGSRNTFF